MLPRLPQEKRGDHPSYGEIVIAEEVDTKPCEAEKWELDFLHFVKKGTLEQKRNKQTMMSTKQLLCLFESKSTSALSQGDRLV